MWFPSYGAGRHWRKCEESDCLPPWFRGLRLGHGYLVETVGIRSQTRHCSHPSQRSHAPVHLGWWGEKRGGRMQRLSCDLFFAQVWHDRRELNINAWEDNEGIKEMARRLDQLVQYKPSFANNNLIYTGGRNS